MALLLLAGCMPLGTTTTTSTSSKKLYFEDMNYEMYVGNVIVNSTNPFIELSGSSPLTLEFDLLTNTFENLQARYIHCNFDWTQSRVPEMEYLASFNRFDHKSFDYSINTKTKYIQYFFELARPRFSGNYLVVLARRDNPDDILFTRRVVFYKREVHMNALLRVPNQVNQRQSHQQLDFDMSYNQLEAPNPQQNFKTVIMQNKNWNSAIIDLKPTNMEPGSKRMEWRYFQGETTFPGWNQFRFLDLRTLNYRGFNVANIENKESGVQVVQGLDQSFGGGAYRQLINDINGRMIPGNSDPGESWLESDYAFVQFGLKTEKIDGKIWITGRYNDWRKSTANLMRYDETNGIYIVTLRLKQGFYDYRYEVESASMPPYSMEGSHYQAENEYDILVYYRAQGSIRDEVVGLTSLNSVDFF
jgi:hypothetical protein